MTLSERWFWLVVAALGALILYVLAPVLTPFLVSALLAYLGDPLVDRIEALRWSRTLGVVVVFIAMFVGGLALLVVLIPLLERQMSILIHKIPVVVDWVEAFVVPRLALVASDLALDYDATAIRDSLLANWQQIGGVLRNLMGQLTRGGQMIFGWIAYLVLVPVVTFYLLRDWDRLVAGVHDLIPRHYERTVSQIARECDAVLAEFLRGQLLVMACQAVVFVVGLLIVGLDLAFVIGIIAAVLSFVPYLGTIVGVTLAGVAAMIQFQDTVHLIGVLGVFGVAQALEGMVLSPLLVGDRIGLHPVAVIFAVMAGGQLFGIFGMLLALPVAAVVMVLLRHTHGQYKASAFYTP